MNDRIAGLISGDICIAAIVNSPPRRLLSLEVRHLTLLIAAIGLSKNRLSGVLLLPQKGSGNSLAVHERQKVNCPPRLPWRPGS